MKNNLREYRKLHNYTLQEVADLIGINKTTLFKYESGDILNIPIENIIKLAEVYKTSPENLFNQTTLYKYNQFLEEIQKTFNTTTSGDPLLKELKKAQKQRDEMLGPLKKAQEDAQKFSEPFQQMQKDTQKFLEPFQQMQETAQKQQELLNQFNKLNELGQNKVIDYVLDMTELPKYQKDDPTE